MSIVSSTRNMRHVTSHGLGDWVRGGLRIGAGFLAGGPAGAVAAGASLVGGRNQGAQWPQPGTGRPRGIAIPRFGPQRPAPAPVVGHIGAGGSPGPGYHLNKSDYFLRDGTFVPKGTRWVKNRRRNAMNPKALTRAIQRVEAGKSWQAKLSGITTAKYTASGKRKDRC